MWLLPPRVRKPLLNGLRSAFPDISDFDSFLRSSCNIERSEIVPDTANIGYKKQIERVLRNAEYKKWVPLLVQEAEKENPTNEFLASAAELYRNYLSKSPVARTPSFLHAFVLRFHKWILAVILVSVVLIALAFIGPRTISIEADPQGKGSTEVFFDPVAKNWDPSVIESIAPVKNNDGLIVRFSVKLKGRQRVSFTADHFAPQADYRVTYWIEDYQLTDSEYLNLD